MVVLLAAPSLLGEVVTIGGKEVPIGKQPELDEFRQLLISVQQELLAITAHQETLKAISAAAPAMLTGVKASITNVVEHTQPEIEPQHAQSIQKSLTEAKGLLSTVLAGAKTAAEESEALQDTVEQLEPLVQQTDVLEQWAVKLWATK